MKSKIKKTAFRTNCVTVKDFQEEVFISRFMILVAESADERRRLRYSDFDNEKNILSCFIGKSRQPGHPFSAHILTKREEGYGVIDSLRSTHEDLLIREYEWCEEGVWDAVRLLALCMNYFLDDEKYPPGMAYYGGYHLCSPVDFGVSVSKEQRVCMSLSIDNNNLLVPRTVTFTTPKEIEKAKGPFYVIDGYQITLVPESKKNDFIKGNIKIYERRNPFDKHTIPWLRFKSGSAIHGKNHEAYWFIRRMNVAYNDFLSLEYRSVEDYDICDVVKKDIVRSTESIIHDLLSGQTIFIDDKSCDIESQTLERRLTADIEKRYGRLLSVGKEESSLLEIHIVKDLSAKRKEGFVDNYEAGGIGTVVQHITQEKAGCKESELKSIVDKILLELAIKKAFVCKEESRIGSLPNGWGFMILNTERIKEEENLYLFRNTVAGMGIESSGKAAYSKPFTFINEWGRYSGVIDRAKEYGSSDTVFMMQHGRNTYMIVDTMEVPILDQGKIMDDERMIQDDTAADSFFEKLLVEGVSEEGITIVRDTLNSLSKTNKNGEVVSRFKGFVGPKILKMLTRELPEFGEKEKIVSVTEDYSSSMHFLARRRHSEFLEEFFGGYTNIHVWWEDYGKMFCYIASIDPDSLDMKESGKIVTMPHVRKVILYSGNENDMVRDKDIILEMLKTGLGKYGSAMAYPYPFKLLKEYMSLENRKKDIKKH